MLGEGEESSRGEAAMVRRGGRSREGYAKERRLGCRLDGGCTSRERRGGWEEAVLGPSPASRSFWDHVPQERKKVVVERKEGKEGNGRDVIHEMERVERASETRRKIGGMSNVAGGGRGWFLSSWLVVCVCLVASTHCLQQGRDNERGGLHLGSKTSGVWSLEAAGEGGRLPILRGGGVMMLRGGGLAVDVKAARRKERKMKLAREGKSKRKNGVPEVVKEPWKFQAEEAGSDGKLVLKGKVRKTSGGETQTETRTNMQKYMPRAKIHMRILVCTCTGHLVPHISAVSAMKSPCPLMLQSQAHIDMADAHRLGKSGKSGGRQRKGTTCLPSGRRMGITPTSKLPGRKRRSRSGGTGWNGESEM
jgi:hypothetical protein